MLSTFWVEIICVYSYQMEDFLFFQVLDEHVISSTEEYQPPYYEHVEENEYLFDRWINIMKFWVFYW